MQKCSKCRKEEEDKYKGAIVPVHGRIMMGCHSGYDFNVYQFTLVPGWYCWGCLDQEVKAGLCQPLMVWKRPATDRFDDTLSPWEYFYPKRGMTLDEEQAQKNWERFSKKFGLD